MSLDTYNDSIYIVGHLGSDYDGGYTIEPNQNDSVFINRQSMFLASHNSSGELNWLEEFITTDPDSGFILPFKIREYNGNIFVSGEYQGPVIFNPATDTIHQQLVPKKNGSFLVKLNTDTQSIFNWVVEYKSWSNKSLGTYNPKISFSKNDILLSGAFSDTSVIIRQTTSPYFLYTSDFCDVDENNCINSFIHKFRDPNYEEEVIPEPEFNLTIFPNPTNNYVEVHFGKPVEKVSVKITDLSGKKVIEKIYNENNESIIINLSYLASSVYVIEIKVQDDYFFRKLIIQ